MITTATNKIPEMVTLKDAAKRTGLSYYYLRNQCLAGKIVHIRAGAKILINFDRLINLLNGEEENQGSQNAT